MFIDHGLEDMAPAHNSLGNSLYKLRVPTEPLTLCAIFKQDSLPTKTEVRYEKKR